MRKVSARLTTAAIEAAAASEARHSTRSRIAIAKDCHTVLTGPRQDDRGRVRPVAFFGDRALRDASLVLECWNAGRVGISEGRGGEGGETHGI